MLFYRGNALNLVVYCGRSNKLPEVKEMFKKLFVCIISIVGLATANIIGGAVPRKPARESGEVSDPQAKNNLGQLYQMSYVDSTITGTGYINFLIDLTSATYTRDRTHLKIKTSGLRDAMVTLYENPTVTSSGTIITPVCKNRELADTPQTQFFREAVVSSSGTILSTLIISDRHSIEPEIEQQWIVPDGNSYLMTLLNTIGGTAEYDLGLAIEFFETED